jgi:putative peptidoglycan lipid II flippase
VITVLSYLIMPTIFFYGLSAISGAILYSRGHFAAPMWTPILNNMVVIATGGLYLLLFGAKPIRPEDITGAQLAVIGGGTLLGILVQSIGLWPALRRVGFRWRWRFDFRALGLRELGRLGIWMFCYVAVSQIGVLVLLNLLNRANDNGNVAGPMIYNNVYLLLMMAHGIVAVSIITALLPRMSAAAHERRFGDVAADLSRGTRTSAAVLAPIAVCYVVLAQPAMITLFERGAFTRGQAIDGAGVLVIAGFALIPFAISQLVTFAFYALADTKTPAVTNLPVVGTRILIQVGVFMAFAASFTATGLMLGNAISYVLAVGLAVMLLRPRVGRLGARAIAATLFKVAAAALGAGLVGWLVLKMLPIGDDVTRLEAAVQLVVGASAVLVTYLVLSVVLRIREIKEVLDLVRRRLGRR